MLRHAHHLEPPAPAAVHGPDGACPAGSQRSSLEQARSAGVARRGLLGLAGLAACCVALPARAAPCEGPPPRIDALAPGLWWVPAAPGDASPHNRGQVSNLLLAAEGPRLWLIGSGPSPAFGRALACAVQARWQRRVTDIVTPWARPEAVLGLAAWPGARRWAHAEVAAAMAARCTACVAGLRERLGEAAADLGEDPVRIPDRLLDGAQGRLGPFAWWRLARAEGVPVTVWRHAASGVAFAPGLLWGDAAPDGRDADLARLAQATAALKGLRADAGPARRWLGEQGGPQDARAPRQAAAYWAALQAAVAAGLTRGDDGQAVPATLPGVSPRLTADPRHALNWQRAWRQSEDRWLQRSLR